MKREKSKCLVPGCGRESKSRGLCLKDYKAVAKLIKSGETTWEKQEKIGNVSPTTRGKSTAWFLRKA